MTDRPDTLSRRPERADDAGAEAMDVLSDVLHSVRLTGSMLFVVDASSPWISQAPAADLFSSTVLPGSRHIISYHIVTQGHCDAGLADGPRHRLGAGDILVIPHGDPYFLCDLPTGARPACDSDEALAFFREMAAGKLPTVIPVGGDGEPQTRFICGFLGCDSQPFNPVLAALPSALILRRSDFTDSRMDALIDFALGELRNPGSGSRNVLLRLSELMFATSLRHYLQSRPEAQSGWLAGLSDPLVARALTLLHAHPEKAWTLESLCSLAGTSRTVLTERFGQLIGQPPMRYLNAWRMQKAAGLLAEGTLKVAAVAAAVGYDSEAAFSRAFRKFAGRPPARWRQGE
ncbi:MAG: AraC family transcriptional regulator [Oceanospirillaceae bacterium]|nr:AraC family transcriptional regulator [Oceanospirillaceae bacterium]